MAEADANSNYVPVDSLPWSVAEKQIARKAFQSALDQELKLVMREVKRRAGKIQEPTELWELEEYLTRRRTEIDRLYDYRYSVLPVVFGDLIGKGRLSEDDLRGLGEDKMRFVRLTAADYLNPDQSG